MTTFRRYLSKNQTVKNQKNTQESMKAFLRGKYEAIKASCEETNCSELGTDELEESKGDFLFFADRAMRVVTKLIDAHEISLSEENVDRWFSILLGNMIRTYGRLSDYQHATCAFILEGKTMVVDVYETEEGKYTVRTQMVNPAE